MSDEDDVEKCSNDDEENVSVTDEETQYRSNEHSDPNENLQIVEYQKHLFGKQIQQQYNLTIMWEVYLKNTFQSNF